MVNYFLEYHKYQPDGINLEHKDIVCSNCNKLFARAFHLLLSLFYYIQKENTIIDLAQRINREAYRSLQIIHPQTFEKHKVTNFSINAHHPHHLLMFCTGGLEREDST